MGGTVTKVRAPTGRPSLGNAAFRPPGRSRLVRDEPQRLGSSEKGPWMVVDVPRGRLRSAPPFRTPRPHAALRGAHSPSTGGLIYHAGQMTVAAAADDCP
jgi:hypothetical protein